MTDRPQRRDAARNRARIVETAARAFREEGLDVGVDEIARRTGVNIATLYRHFPSKDHLVSAVMSSLLEPLTQARDAALGRETAILETFLTEAARLQLEHRGLVDALGKQPAGWTVREQLREAAVALLEPLASHLRTHGELRSDLDVGGLLLAVRMLGVAAAPDDSDPGACIDILLRGLRA
jgi:AcrR family transcriptional regulator